MDNLGKTISNLSLFEVKAYVRKAQNAVLNLSEIEAKVREATNNEPWGAPSSLMAEISRGTFNYRDREEISSMIFRRFTEKSAHEWRQIYKALQLMEYLVKNGSERFVDDARANVNLVSMLKSFHYTDSKGVDQGINIRNRSRELSILLNDEAKIRQERKKAKENSKKYGGLSSNTYSGSSRYSGRAGSSSVSASTDYEEDAGYSGRVFGDGGVFGQRFEQQQSTAASKTFEEYNVEGTTTSSSASKRRSSKPSVSTSKVTAKASTKASQPTVDLFSFDDPVPASSKKQSVSAANNDDDDDDEFDDFITAEPTAGPAASTPAATSNNLADLLSTAYTPQATQQQQLQQQQQQQASFTSQLNTPAISQPKKNDDLFGSLLVSAKSKTHVSTPTAPKATNTTSANDDLFGSFATPAAAPSKPQQQTKAAGNDQVMDLLSF